MLLEAAFYKILLKRVRENTASLSDIGSFSYFEMLPYAFKCYHIEKS